MCREAYHYSTCNRTLPSRYGAVVNGKVCKKEHCDKIVKTITVHDERCRRPSCSSCAALVAALPPAVGYMFLHEDDGLTIRSRNEPPFPAIARKMADEEPPATIELQGPELGGSPVVVSGEMMGSRFLGIARQLEKSLTGRSRADVFPEGDAAQTNPSYETRKGKRKRGADEEQEQSEE